MLTYDLQAGDQPKYYRLYTCIREDILRAELPPGQKLPSKRALPEQSHRSTKHPLPLQVACPT